tara:strand:+ start:2106 stop:3338 length:1233 start_codon:yes stop_codon:yes gene_type:complete
MKKIAILVDLELSESAGGHVKYWERICNSIKDSYKDFNLEVIFLGKELKKKSISKNINFFTIRPLISSKILKPLGVDADVTDLSPFNIRLFFMLKRYDLIHTTDQFFSMARTAKHASKFWKIPLTTSLHTDTPSYTEYYVKKILSNFPRLVNDFLVYKIKIHKKISKNQVKKFKKYLVHCRYAMINDKLNVSKFNFSKEVKSKISRLSRGVNKKIFKKVKINKERLLKKYEINKNEKIIFFCGRIHELKGAVFLSKVHKIIQNTGYKVVSIFAGQNLHGKECLKYGGSRIKLVDYLDEKEISQLYNLCDLFVFPSKFEIGPQVVLEAKSCGAISVVTPKGGGKRISANGIDGIIIENYDPKEWASRIIKLLKKQEKLKYMRKMILSNYQPPSWEQVFEEHFHNKWRKILN